MHINVGKMEVNEKEHKLTLGLRLGNGTVEIAKEKEVRGDGGR